MGWVPLARPLPQCLCANTDTFMGFVDDPDYDTYSMAGVERMPLHYQEAPISDASSAGDHRSLAAPPYPLTLSGAWRRPVRPPLPGYPMGSP